MASHDQSQQAQAELYSLRKEAQRIFRQVLLPDERLQLSAKVVGLSDKTRFDAAGTMDTPYLPVPLKFSESSAAL
ncbi:CAIB BAIF family enzyme [Pyrenophora tritici-repentis]|uniref:CAIB/BAIF family enzyme n=1 Tax=Pyrenophora tritici-repentis TaxID=45151 RepID=A0A2W1D8H4_9PLEO|nr:CAIB/BAIF family enzyme [Pyrenophora tritici-repentis]KAF7449280.1 CAIB/BAIF family enzyme [Pyrenophora tritici-repentis]KAF7570706.1 hypothetical protein PtrM4_107080 [Pyrenophora tritici-repentis]KAG9383777.1 CAIB/BAIF family enzyme [Pyrenophora tritici-repentis]KAI0570966.1 CAIB/BAIF family enzyme [Pyrenophora tritici-repentis]